MNESSSAGEEAREEGEEVKPEIGEEVVVVVVGGDTSEITSVISFSSVIFLFFRKVSESLRGPRFVGSVGTHSTLWRRQCVHGLEFSHFVFF